VGGEDLTTRVIVYQLVLVSSLLLFIVILLIGTVFCFVKIIILVWTTSSKIAKLLRTDDRQLVFALRRRMYAYLSVCAICAVLIVLDCILNGFEYTVFLNIIVLQVALHFLEFVRHGVASLDEYELREMGISDGVECEGVSQMDPIEPLSPSELESENAAKQKK
jgi:hypothetical protein